MKAPRQNVDIAIIGLSCRFPGAATAEEFWKNLCDGVESITFFSDQELVQAGVDPALVANPNYVKAAPMLRDVELFDAAFFGYSPKDGRVDGSAATSISRSLLGGVSKTRAMTRLITPERSVFFRPPA